jgi:hypothetical protein
MRETRSFAGSIELDGVDAPPVLASEAGHFMLMPEVSDKLAERSLFSA